MFENKKDKSGMLKAKKVFFSNAVKDYKMQFSNTNFIRVFRDIIFKKGNNQKDKKIDCKEQQLR